MKKSILLIWVVAMTLSTVAQNPLNIPSTLSGPNINLTLQLGTTVFYPGITTNTMGANGNLLGPTLLLKKDSLVSIVVDNQLGEPTTIHWHGMHVAPQNDGGPHSVIAAGTTWNPQFTVLDKAGINWYHPHLHMQTDKHVSKGIAGLIIVEDAEEQALNLPNTYGIDDFPLVLQTKGFDALGQILVHTELDTSVMVNGTVDAYVDFPAQVVRLRVLNGSSQRVMEIGFSDNRSFELIGTDGGLLNTPVNLTRYRIAPGQRADILLDLTGSIGQNFQLMSFGAELPNAIYGATQPGMGAGATSSLVGYVNNPLNGNNYSFLDINVVGQTVAPVTTVPSTLAVYTPIAEGTENITRELSLTSGGGMGNLAGPFLINGTSFDMMVINYIVPPDNIEIWSLTNETPIAHPFHIHDVQFFILDINGVSPPPALQGYNDVVLVPAGMGNVRFIAQFTDFVNDTVPYMFHCHMLTHEDMGMMGQFLVSTQVLSIDEKEDNHTLVVYPNPSSNGVFTINTGQENDKIVSYQIYSVDGKLVQNDINVSNMSWLNIEINKSGIYILVVEGADWIEQVKIFVD